MFARFRIATSGVNLPLAHPWIRTTVSWHARPRNSIKACRIPETTVSPGEYGDLLSKTLSSLSSMLQLTEPVDPEKLLSSYGLDSLSRIQPRLWLNTQLSVDVSTFDVIDTPTLASLRDMVAAKLRAV